MDACERLGNSRFSAAGRAEITVNVNTEEGYFEVLDNGDGMSPDVLSEYFAVIGRSIREEEDILERMQGDEKTRAHLIGKFGIGFISAYMLARKILISTTREGHEQINFEINGISDPFIYHDFSQVGRAPEEGGTTVRVYLKDSFLPGGANPLDVPAAIQQFCRHVQFIKVFKDGEAVTIKDVWNIEKASILHVTGVPVGFELHLGISKESYDFYASNAGFLVSRSAGAISPKYMPRNMGGEINFYPGVVDLNMARDAVIENDKSAYVRGLVSKAIRNLLIKAATENDEKMRGSLRMILVAYLDIALKYEKMSKVAGQASSPERSTSSLYAVDSNAPPLTSIEAAELLMDVWDGKLGDGRLSIRDGLRVMKEGGKNRVYVHTGYYGENEKLFELFEESLKKRGFLVVSVLGDHVEFKSGQREFFLPKSALDYLSKRYYFDVYDVEKPFAEDIEDLTISKDILSPALRNVIRNIEQSTGKQIRLSGLKGAPVVFELAGDNYLNIGSELFSSASASFEHYDESMTMSYVLGLLRYEMPRPRPQE